MLLTFFACERADTLRSVATIDCSVENGQRVTKRSVDHNLILLSIRKPDTAPI